MTAEIVALRIMECHHVHESFWNLGDITHEVPADVLFERIPDTRCTRDAHCMPACYVVDAYDAAGNIVDDKEITAALAQQLLDEPIEVLRERYRKWLWDTYGVTG